LIAVTFLDALKDSSSAINLLSFGLRAPAGKHIKPAGACDFRSRNDGSRQTRRCAILNLLDNLYSAFYGVSRSRAAKNVFNESATPRRSGQVVDIFAALKKSLETAGQQKATAERGKRKKRKRNALLYFPEAVVKLSAAVWASKK
jgi:hypothetical protein